MTSCWQWRNDSAQLRRPFAVQLFNEEATTTTEISPFFFRLSEPFGDIYISTFTWMTALQSLFGCVYVPFLSSQQPLSLQQLTGGVVLRRSINSSCHWKMWCLLLLQKAMVRRCHPCATADQQFGVKRRAWLWLRCLNSLCHDERWVCSRIAVIFTVNTNSWYFLGERVKCNRLFMSVYLHYPHWNKHTHWKSTVERWFFLLGRPIFRGYVSFRECTHSIYVCMSKYVWCSVSWSLWLLET